MKINWKSRKVLAPLGVVVFLLLVAGYFAFLGPEVVELPIGVSYHTAPVGADQVQNGKAVSATPISFTQKMPDLAVKALATSNTVTLFSLEPDGFGTIPKGPEKFHDWQVLGKVALTGSQAVQAAHEFQQAVDRVKHPSMAMCFEPRHGLQVIDGSHTFDFVLCYACGQLEVYEDNKEITVLPVESPPENILNKILVAAQISLPRQPY